MEIKSLPQEVRSQLRNGTNINNVTQCVTELVLNSLDAKSTSIAVRVNLLTFQIQVVDNGRGITQSNMIPIGNRFMTSKCHSLADLKHIKYFGFRGEALASIRGISKSLSITSRPENVDNTYSKVYKNGKWGEVECIKKRPSKGTTVTVEGFMNNLPVRQKRINQSVDMESIKKMLESLAIINSKVSFNLRNDANGKTILKSSKTVSVSQALVNFYPHISIDNLVQVKVSRDKIHISGLIYKSTFSNNKLQFIYLNKRVIISSKIQKLVNSLLSKIILQKSETQAANNSLPADKNTVSKNEYPVYVLNIRCPFSEVDLTLCPTKKNVEFKNWDIILACFKKAINSLAQNEKTFQEITNKLEAVPLEGCKSQFGISQICGVIKSVPIRRNRLIEKSNESLKIVNEDKSSDKSSDVQMLNPGTRSHCDYTTEKVLASCSQVGDKRKIEETNNDDKIKVSKIEDNLHDSDSFFDTSLSKSEEKIPVQVKQKKNNKIDNTNIKTKNKKINDSYAVIPLKKVANQLGTKNLDKIADSCKDLSFGNSNLSYFPIFCQNENLKEKVNSKKCIDHLGSAKEQGNGLKNIEQRLSNLPSGRKSGSKSMCNENNMENEVEGKKFIMNMFLKSTAMFSDNEELNVVEIDNSNNEKKNEVDGKIVTSAEGNDKQPCEEIEKLDEPSAEELLPKICFGQHTLNKMKMPQFGSMECFRQPIVYENINIISEEFYKPIGLKNIFDNKKFCAKSICYTKSVYKTAMPKSILNLDTYQELMQPKSNCCNFLNINKKMFSNFQNNFAKYDRKNHNAPVPLYQRHRSKNHIPKMNDAIFQQEQFNINFATSKINSFGVKFFKNFDRKVNSNFENHDYIIKSVNDKLQAEQLYKSTIKPAVLNVPRKPKALVFNKDHNGNNFDYGREKLYESVFQSWIPNSKTKSQNHVFKKPYDIAGKTKEVFKVPMIFPVAGRNYACQSPYFCKSTEKAKKNFLSKDRQKIFTLQENRSRNHKKIVDKNMCSPYFEKNENRFIQNDQMNKSKYFKKKSSSLQENGKSNFFRQVQESNQDTNFVVHFKDTEKITSRPAANYRQSKPIFLKNTEVVDENLPIFFPKTKPMERKEFIECPQKKPQRSKLSLRKLNSPEYLSDSPNREFQEKSIYFQQQNFPKPLFQIDKYQNNGNCENVCNEFELPSQNKNINITFKSGKIIYQEKTCTVVDADVAKNDINSTPGFKRFQPKLSSTVIDKDRIDENINISVENEETGNPNKLVEEQNNCNYEVEENRSFNFFPKEVEEQCPTSNNIIDECEPRQNISVLNFTNENLKKLFPASNFDKNADDCEKIKPRENCNLLNDTIEDLKKLFVTSNGNNKSNVGNNSKESRKLDKNNDDCEKIEPKRNCNVLNVTIKDLKKLLATSDDNVKNTSECKKIYSILNASILDLKKALLTSFEVNNETQKNCNMLNTSIEDLKSIFSGVNKKMENNFEVLKPTSKKQNEEWIEHIDKDGNVSYLNRETGMTSVIKPCEDSIFSLAPRTEFAHKGFPPLLKERESKQIVSSLSPKSKKALNSAILESYEDELNTVKWSNLINEDTDVKQFFDDLYREKSKQFDRLIPNASVNTLQRGIVKIYNNLEAESITKDIFEDLTIIGQWDNKFIIALVKKKGMMILFDQHAVHERIRLENLLEEYIEKDEEVHKFKTTKCDEPVVFELNDSEINILLNYQHLLEDLGLIYEISANNIYIFYVPTCIYNRILKNPKKHQEVELKNFVCSLVCEEINTILSTRGIGIKIPILMQNILNSEACRGAIKFGDKLNLHECEDLIQKLSKCKLPFQCAHGRPTITPIMNLQQNVHHKQTKINLKKLK